MKKLLVILGAGSSISSGLPSVHALDEHMKGWGQGWASQNNFPDYFESLWRAIHKYYQSGNSGLRPTLNFEKVLGEMVGLAHWMTPAPWGDTLRETACDRAAPPHLTFPSLFLNRIEPYGPTVMVMDQLKHLLIKLAQYIRGHCRELNLATDTARQYATFFNELRRVFDVGVYNLNYDTAALSAWPDACTGFTEGGMFDATSVHQRSEWGFVYHLHGSVHHSLIGEFGSEIRWQRDLREKFFDGHQGLSNDKRSEGRSFPKTTLIAGGFKLDQLLVEPFHSLHAALVRHFYAADAILIGGYGFGDVHVNRALRNRLISPSARPPIMVLDHANDKTDAMSFRHDLWALELCATLNVSGDVWAEPGYSSPAIPSELVTKRSFEVAGPHRVGIWHGGFIEAVRSLDRIVHWLEGEADGLLLPI